MLATGTGATLAGAALLWHSLKAQTYPHGDALNVDISQLPIGQLMTVEWQAKPVWILRRTLAEVTALAKQDALLTDPQSAQSQQPPTCRNGQRSVRADIFVAIGVCTHQGCTPTLQPGSGFLCPCHASRYDLAGRVFHQGPAPANLVIPAYHFASESQLVLGTDA
jgi:ubiquinol-cytochrome c reductase iron-sulfur subunit